MDEARHDTNLGFIRSYHSGAVGTDKHGIFFLNIVIGLHHVVNRNSFGNTDDYLQTCIGCFHDCIRSKWSGDKNNRCVRTGNFDSILYGIVHRHRTQECVAVIPPVLQPALAGGHAGNNIRPVFKNL